MNTTEQILLIILSSALAVFLVLAIVAIVYVIKLLRTLRLVTAKAEHVLESAEQATEVFRQASSSVSLFKLARNVAEMVGRHGKK
jgi:hypothetical protein